MVEEYGRGGHFERELPRARELYASHWRALDGALREHMPDGVAWTEPGRRLPHLGRAARAARRAARCAMRPPEAGVAYVPGAPFYAGDDGAGELRLSFSALGEAELAEAGRRLASVIRSAF